jgi:NAD(P)-dependent dehydrogenase (short-subunit alcohol dehydrogenase family)
MAKSILITGASSGVGRATAEHFLAKGWNVGLLARRVDLLHDIAAIHENALVLACDVVDDVAVKAAFAAFTERFGHLDVLFNNAGIFPMGRVIDEIEVADWRRAVDINLTGSFLCAQAAFSIMRHQQPQGGRIINNGSISAYSPRQHSAPYTATKHAITGLTKSISLDGRPFNIACGQIDIGNAGTEMIASLTARALKANPDATPDPTMDVDHVAQAVFQMADLPLQSNVLFMTLMATEMEFVGRG